MVGDSLTEQGRWGEMFPGVSILNRGIGGDNAGGVARRAHLVLETRPQLIFLMIGLNDIFYPENSDAEVIAELEKAIVRLTQSPAQLIVQSIIVCNSSNPVCPPDRQARLARFNVALKELAERHGAGFLDIGALFAGPRGLREDLTWDGMHLNGAGYALWRDALRPHVERLEGGAPCARSACAVRSEMTGRMAMRGGAS